MSTFTHLQVKCGARLHQVEVYTVHSRAGHAILDVLSGGTRKGDRRVLVAFGLRQAVLTDSVGARSAKVVLRVLHQEDKGLKKLHNVLELRRKVGV